MGYVECTKYGWWAHFVHMVGGRCPKCGGTIQGLDITKSNSL